MQAAATSLSYPLVCSTLAWLLESMRNQVLIISDICVRLFSSPSNIPQPMISLFLHNLSSQPALLQWEAPAMTHHQKLRERQQHLPAQSRVNHRDVRCCPVETHNYWKEERGATLGDHPLNQLHFSQEWQLEIAWCTFPWAYALFGARCLLCLVFNRTTDWCDECQGIWALKAIVPSRRASLAAELWNESPSSHRRRFLFLYRSGRSRRDSFSHYCP